MFEFLSSLDENLVELIAYLGVLAYLLFFVMVFCESGVVPMIFLPGDGFVFSLGVVARQGALEIFILLPLLIVAGISGYFFNYWTGAKLGLQLLDRRKWVKPEHLDKTRAFFRTHGRSAVFIGRFIPIVRTIVPFVAGVAHMSKWYFGWYNLVGGTIQISTYCLAGYFLGQLPFVKENFIWIYLGMILVSTVPTFITVTYKSRKK